MQAPVRACQCGYRLPDLVFEILTFLTQSGFVCQAAQEREELQRTGDDLDAKIRKAEKEIRQPRPTVKVLWDDSNPRTLPQSITLLTIATSLQGIGEHSSSDELQK